MPPRSHNLYIRKRKKRRISNANSILNGLIRLIIIIALARYGGPTRFGIISFFTIFYFFLLIMDNLWIRQILTREINRKKSSFDYLSTVRIIIGNGIIMRILLSLVTIIFLWINTLIINRPIITEVSFYISIGLILMAIYLSFEMTPKLSLKGNYNTSLLLLRKIAVLVLIFLIIFLTGTIPRLYKLVLIPGFLIAAWAAYSSMKTVKPIFKINFELWRKVGKAFKFLGLPAILIFFYFHVSYLMLLYIKGFHELGAYGAAINLTESLGFFLIPLTVSISPSPLILKHLKAYGRIFRVKLGYLLLIILIAIGVTIFSRSIISTVYGKQFLGITPALSILIWAEVLVFIGIVNSFISFAKRNRIMNLVFMGIAVLINVSLNLILIPKYGFVGTAIATLISYGVWPNNKILYINYIRA